MSENRLPKLVSTVSLNMAHVPVVGSGRDTRTCWSTIWRRAASIRRNSRH